MLAQAEAGFFYVIPVEGHDRNKPDDSSCHYFNHSYEFITRKYKKHATPNATGASLSIMPLASLQSLYYIAVNSDGTCAVSGTPINN